MPRAMSRRFLEVMRLQFERGTYCSARTGSAKSVVHPLWARMWVPVVVVVW